MVGLSNGTNNSPWKVLAQIKNSGDTSNGLSLILQTEAIVNSNGLANFTYLGLSTLSNNVQLEFVLEAPLGVNG